MEEKGKGEEGKEKKEGGQEKEGGMRAGKSFKILVFQ